MKFQSPNTFEEFNNLSDEDKLNHYLSLNDKQKNELIPSSYGHGIVEIKPTKNSPTSQKFLKLYKKAKLIPDNINSQVSNDSFFENDNVPLPNNNDFQENENINGYWKNTSKFERDEAAKNILNDMNYQHKDPRIVDGKKQMLINARINALKKMGKTIDIDPDTGEFYFNN
jgi:hypothetical protein